MNFSFQLLKYLLLLLVLILLDKEPENLLLNLSTHAVAKVHDFRDKKDIS